MGTIKAGLIHRGKGAVGRVSESVHGNCRVIPVRD